MNFTKSKTAKLVGAAVGFAMTISAVMPAVASADTASDLQAQINSLLATISALQAQLSATTGGSTVSTGYTFNTNLTIGSTGTDVMNLQKVLNMSADTRVAASGAGSPGMETSTFGPLTRSAVMKFQTKFGISPVAGYVGPVTRAKLNTMGGSTTTGGTTTIPGVAGSLTVMAGAQPANSLAPKGASRVPFTNFTITAGATDVTVNSVTVQRTGLAQDAAVSGVVLLDSATGVQIGIAKTLNSNHQALIGEPFVVKAGTSKMVTVAANMASSLADYVGQVLALDVVAINTSASVTGSLPIMGAQQTLNNTLTIGTATISSSSYDPNSAGSQPIGTTNFRFSGIKVTAGSAEDVTFKSIRWNQTSSVGASDLANLVTVVNGTSYPTVASADGKYFSTVFPSGIVIAKGNSVDVYIQGDIVGSGASGRIAEFDIYKNTDIYLSGNTYSYGITATLGSTGTVSTASTHATNFAASSTANPMFQGSTLSITAGSVTLIGKANEVSSANIAINVPNQVLGGFATNFAGEPVSVQTLKFLLSTSSTAGTTVTSYSAVTNITIVDENGAVVAGPVDATVGDGTTTYGGQALTSASYGAVRFTDTITFPTGRHVYTIKGKIPSGWANGATVNMFSAPVTDWSNITGQTTGTSVTISTTAFSMNQMTVKGATLAVNISAQPAAQNVVGGIQNFVLANYQLDATQSGEDIRLSALPLKVDFTGTPTVGDLTGCVLWDGTTQLNTGSRVKNVLTDNASMTFSFDNSLTVTKGTSKTLALSCNVASSPVSDGFQVNADTDTANWSVTGITSGNTVTPTFGSGNGGLMTKTSGSFAVSIDSSTASYTTVAAGTSGVTMGTFRFRASNEDVNLSKVGLALSTSTAADIGTVYLYQGSTLLGTAIFPQGAGAVATSTLNSALKLTRDTEVLITIKADLAAIGTGQSGTEGRLVKIDVTNAEGSGLSSGNTLQVGGVTAGVNGVRVFKSYPTVSADTLASTGVSDGKLMRFKITAAPQGPVGIFSLDFSIATSSFVAGGGVTSPKVMVYSDSSYSLPVSGSFGVATGQFGSTGFVQPTVGNPATFTASTTGAYVPLQIPAGTTYYFQVEATVASTQTGTSVTTILNGDSSYISSTHFAIGTIGPTIPMVSSTTGAIADSENDFIWSGNATSTAGVNSLDWANGYGISGLPSGGLSQTRSN